MKQKEYKRPGVRKPESPRSVSTYSKYHHTIDREIDNDNIWYIEINGKKERRIPVTLSSWEEMKFKAKEGSPSPKEHEYLVFLMEQGYCISHGEII